MNLPRENHEVDEAERGLVAAAILAPYVVDDVLEIITHEDFRNGVYGTIFKAIETIKRDNQVIDAVLLSETLKRFGSLGDKVYETLAEIIQDQWSTPWNATHYAKQIRERSIKTRLADGLTKAVQIALDSGATSEEAISEAERRLTALRDAKLDSRLLDAVALTDLGIAAIRERSKGQPPGLRFGFRELDAKTSLGPGQLWILAGRPGHGKSALALNIATNVCQSGNPVAFFSMEMSSEELSDRIFASHAGVNHEAIRKGILFEHQWDSIVDFATIVRGWKIYVDDKPAQTVSHIASKARKLRRKHDGLGLIVVDYLQLIKPETRRDATREEQVATMSRGLKELAMELKWPVLCLAQLNRKAEETDRPKLSNLRESGAIEQDADCVMFIHRADVYRKQSERDGTAVAILAKQRSGETGDCNLLWTGEHVRFSDPPLAEAWNPNEY